MTFLSAHDGELMALLGALIFAWTSVFFTIAGHRLGVTTVNLLRLPIGMTCLALTHLAATGSLWPTGLALPDVVWLGLSGIVGLAVGDSALFKSFTLIGPRRGMTIMALAPVFTTVLAWSTLGEHLGPLALAGIAVVIGGVVIASLGRDGGKSRFANLPPGLLRTGLLLALVGSLGQGLGSVFAKMGMVGTPSTAGASPLAGTLVRITFATVAYWIVVLPRQNLGAIACGLRDRRGVSALAVGILMGPFISVWISLVAIDRAPTGIAQALLGTVPVFVVIPAWVVYRDKPSALSLLGIFIAVAGGSLLFLR
ncbi:DMT family transporter [bacterium]|nr:DMT family transporter [bacterium]